MKNFVFDFGEFVNESFSPGESFNLSSCCNAKLDEDNHCMECGAFETHSEDVNDENEETFKNINKQS